MVAPLKGLETLSSGADTERWSTGLDFCWTSLLHPVVAGASVQDSLGNFSQRKVNCLAGTARLLKKDG